MVGVVGELGQALLGLATGLGEVGDDDLTGSARHFQGLPMDGDLTDLGRVDPLAARRLGPHLVPGPHGPELGTLERQLAHELSEPRVVQMAGDRTAQRGDAFGGDRIPVGEHHPRPGVKEDVAHHVAHVALQLACRFVAEQDVHEPAQDECRPRRGIDERLHRARHVLIGGSDRCGHAGERGQITARLVVQAQDPGQGVHHLLGRTAITPAFEPDVVLGADPGQHRDLFAAQAGHPPAAEVGQAVFFRARELTTRPQEIAEKVHPATIRRVPDAWGAPTSTPLGSASLGGAIGRNVVGMTNTTQADTILQNRISVVTGASGGIGAATARRLAAAGARVAVLGRRADRLTTLADEIGGLAVVADVTGGAEAMGAAADQIRAELGRPDLIVANAGVMLGAPFDTAERAEWTAMLDTNVRGLIDTGRAFTPDLVAAAADGHPADLVFVGSIASTNYYPTYAVYCATKAAVAALARGLRAEFGPRGVRVRNVEPGLTASELGAGMLDRQARESLAGFRETLDSIPASDIAEAIGWAVSLPARVNVAELVVLPTAQG